MNTVCFSRMLAVCFLIVCIFISGCTESAPPVNTTESVTVPTTAPDTPQYSAGDIVKNPRSSSETAWLIISYNPSADTYERAFIYRNNDGSWGYRVDTRTESLDRSMLEKVNTEKVTSVTVSQVPVSQPATIAPQVTTSPKATSAATVVTTTAAAAPRITGIETDNALAGTTVSITDLVGSDFKAGAKVILIRSGSQNISASSVTVVTATKISCSISIPLNATVGYWDVMVANPDGQYHRYMNGFRIKENTAATTTTTTTTTSASTATISSVDPPTVVAGGAATNARPTIYGTNLPTNGNAKLTKSGSSDIIGTSPYFPTTNSMQVSFDIPAGSNGVWNVVVINSDLTTAATLSNAFTVI